MQSPIQAIIRQTEDDLDIEDEDGMAMLKQFIASKCDSNGFSREELNPFRDVILST